MGLFDLIDSILDKIGHALGASTPDALPDVDGTPATGGAATDHLSSGISPEIQSTMDSVQGTASTASHIAHGDYSPEQLAEISDRTNAQMGMLQGGIAHEQAMLQDTKFHQDLLDSKAQHEAIQATDKTLIHGESVESAAEEAIDKAKDAL